jgi:hypothetical protein
LIGSGSDVVSAGDDCVAPCEHLAAAWKDLGAKVAARWMSEGHLRPRRETCDFEGREEDHIVVVIQVAIMDSRESSVEFDGAKHCCECYKKVRVVNSFVNASVPRQLQAAESRHAQEFLGSCTLP